MEQARALAERSEDATTAESESRIVALYQAVFARDPNTEERAACQAFVAAPADPATKLSPWEQLAQVLLSSNELMYVD